MGSDVGSDVGSTVGASVGFTVGAAVSGGAAGVSAAGAEADAVVPGVPEGEDEGVGVLFFARRDTPAAASMRRMMIRANVRCRFMFCLAALVIIGGGIIPLCPC